MIKKKPRRGRKVLPSGRSAENKRYVRLNHWLMDSPAYKDLGPHDVRLLVELYRLYNGYNNGDLFLSCREAARRCNMSKNTASKSFQRLTDRGFIHRRAHYPEKYHQREANHWILTEFDFAGRQATKDFMRWPADTQNQKGVPEKGHLASKTGLKDKEKAD